MQPNSKQTSSHFVATLQLKKQLPPITVRSNFDSGSMGKVELGLNHSIVVTVAVDCMGTQYEGHSKGWFYFGVQGLPLYATQRFIIKKIHFLAGQVTSSCIRSPNSLIISNLSIDMQQSSGADCNNQSLLYNKDEDNQLHFEIQINKSSEIFFAFTFPFSFQDCEKMLSANKILAKANKNVYYHDEVCIRSPQGRPLHLLTLSSHDEKMNVREAHVNNIMFLNGVRPFRFSSSKKVVLITARVHPSEVPASHTMNGVISFLLSKDARAEILRKNFVFKIVPMLNPDGVYHGHHRMDIFNQNLNRYYLSPCPLKQPSAFAVRHLGSYYKMDNRLCFYIDLHAHPQRKGNFIYGNSLEKQDDQIETQLFAKILSLNCIQFEYENSCFSKQHMSMKDRNEEMTKEGCGRVVFNRVLGQVYSYTMECGYTYSNYFNQLQPVSNVHRKYDKLGIQYDDLDNIKGPYYSGKKICFFTIRSYQNLGRCILISILDLFEKNPFSRISNTQFKNKMGIKSQIREQLNKMNKDYKIYATKLTSNLSFKNKESSKQKQRGNITLLNRSIPKKTLKFDRHIHSNNNIPGNRSNKIIDLDRRKTIPKMKPKKN